MKINNLVILSLFVIIPYGVMANVNDDLFIKLESKTRQHIQQLNKNGLKDRAKHIKINRIEKYNKKFNRHKDIPFEVRNFSPDIKNTLITTNPTATTNNIQDIKKILDIRLYPTLRELIAKHDLDIFLGTKQEMLTYYNSMDFDILFEFKIPSSATYYLAKSGNNIVMIMSGLVSHENMIAQLLTLKLANINLEKTNIIGARNNFAATVTNDISKLITSIPDILNGEKILIVAGCGLEEKVNKIVSNHMQNDISSNQKFSGDVISLTHINIEKKDSNITGIISLNLNYGEITENIVENILAICNCKYIFTGSAGGYIDNKSTKKPEIGSYIAITKAKHPSGEIIEIKNNAKSISKLPSSDMHLQVPSIFLETYPWLEQAKLEGSNSVDIETFYIMRAIKTFNIKNPKKVIIGHFGYFVSDHVGEQPLREYSKVFSNYHTILGSFLDECLRK